MRPFDRNQSNLTAAGDWANLPGIHAMGLSYGYALRPELAPQMVPLPKPSAARRKITPAAGKPVKK